MPTKARLLSAGLALALSCHALPAHGQDSRPTHLDPGQPAPFAGLLLEHGHAAALLRAEPQRDRARAEARGLKAQLLRTEHDLLTERQARQVDRDEATARESALTHALHQAEALALRKVPAPSPWYEHPAFLIPATAALTLGTMWTVTALTK